jgi:hypothetical protein
MYHITIRQHYTVRILIYYIPTTFFSIFRNMTFINVLEYSLIVSQTKADSWRFESARERYNLLLETHPEIIKRAPLAHIASYLLMTPETLSRVRSGVL